MKSDNVSDFLYQQIEDDYLFITDDELFKCFDVDLSELTVSDEDLRELLDVDLDEWFDV